jgi:predicted kinase
VRRAEPPSVIVVAGPPCAGKSGVAVRIATALDIPHLEMDRARARILPDSDQRVEHRDIAYRAMHYAAEQLLLRGTSVVLDATYTASVCRRDALEMTDRAGATFYLFECEVPPAVARERFRTRADHPAVDLTPSRVAMLADEYPYFDRACRVRTLVAGDAHPSRLLEHLRSQPLDIIARIAWRQLGRPRERSQQPGMASVVR